MAKSIMQDKARGECYLCNMLLGIDTPAASREEHHAMHGTANRRLAEQYGLKVYLCPYHHRTGTEAVHTSPQTDLILKQAAQRVFEKKYSHEKWMEVFGKNYLDSGEPDDSRHPAVPPPESSRRAAGQFPESFRQAAGQELAATWKNQQNEPFSQFNISQNTPSGFCFLEQSPRREEP